MASEEMIRHVMNPYSDTPIEELAIPRYLIKRLYYQYSVNTIGDLLRLVPSSRDLRRLKYVGEVSARRIEAALEFLGIELDASIEQRIDEAIKVNRLVAGDSQQQIKELNDLARREDPRGERN